MGRFRVRHKSNDIISWDETTRVLIIKDTGKVTFSIEPSKLNDSEGRTILEDYKFDMFNVESRNSYSFFKVDSAGNEIKGTRTHTYKGNKFTVKGKPGRKDDLLWVEFFKDKSFFETSNQTPHIHDLGLYLIFQRPDPVIESVEWIDPKTKKAITEKNLGQYVILRIKSKHLEKETIKISLWEHDGSLESVIMQKSGSPKMVYPHVGYKGGSGYTYTEVSREDIDPETGEKWKGTVESMDFGFSISHDVMKEKLNDDGSLDILVHLNPAWIQDREGKDNMDNLGEMWELELCVKIEHPRLPNYVKKGAKDKETGKRASSGSTLGLFYGKYLNVKKDVVAEEIPLKVSKMVAAIVQNDSQMEAKGAELCKFTYVSVTEKGKEPIVLFKEAAMVPTQLHDFKVLIGDKKKGKKTITIDLDNPKETDPKKKTTVCPDVRGLNLNNTHKGNTFNTEKIDAKFIKTQADNQLVLEAYAERPDIPTALKNAWLPNIDPIPLKVLAQTCRYQRWINIEGYPDLQYELSFKSSPKADSLYEFKSKNFVVRDYKGNMGLLSKKEKKKQKQKKKALLKQQKQDAKNHNVSDAFVYNNFQICFEYGLGNDNKLKEVAIDGQHPIFDAIDTIMYLSNGIAKLCFAKEVKQAEEEHNKTDKNKVDERRKSRNRHLKKVQKNGKKLQKKLKKAGKKIDKLAPFSVTIAPPTFAGSVAWQLANSTQQGQKHELGTQYTIKAKADPLIEIEGRLDLLFVITKVPYIGQAIQAMTAMVDGVDILDDAWNWCVKLFGGGDERKINIDADYHLDLVASGNFKIEAEAVTYHTIDGWGTGEIKPLAEFQFGIEAGAEIKMDIGDFDAEAEVLGKGFCKWVVQKAINDVGEKVWQIEYAGLYAVFYAKLDIENDNGSTKKKKKSEKSKKQDKEKFLIHKGFTYETKIN